jgi:hypothetical protein
MISQIDLLGMAGPRINDLAVGTTLLLMLLGTIVGDLRTAETKTQELLCSLVIVLACIFVSMDHDRYRSWIRDAAGLPTTDKRLFVGVVGPDLACFAVFAAYQAMRVGLLK